MLLSSSPNRLNSHRWVCDTFPSPVPPRKPTGPRLWHPYNGSHCHITIPRRGYLKLINSWTSPHETVQIVDKFFPASDILFRHTQRTTSNASGVTTKSTMFACFSEDLQALPVLSALTCHPSTPLVSTPDWTQIPPTCGDVAAFILAQRCCA